MKKNIIKSTIFLYILLSLFKPIYSSAQVVHQVGENAKPAPVTELINKIKEERGFYKFIVPFGPFSDTFTGQVDLRTGTALIDYLRTWFKFLIGVAGVIAVAKLVFLGFKIILNPGSVDAKKLIRDELTSTIMAIALVAGSWVFLNTLNPALVKTSLLIPKHTTAKAVEEITDNRSTPDNEVKDGITGNGYYFVITDTRTGLKTNMGPYQDIQECKDLLDSFKGGEASSTIKINTGECYDYTNFNSTQSERDLRNSLSSGNVFANRGSCKYENQTSCTRIEGLSQNTISNIVNLAKDCCNGQPECFQSRISNQSYCPVVVVGGTEYGHQSHGMNAPDTYDLRFTSILNSYIKKSASVVAPSFSGNTRYLYNGYWYTDEKNAGVIEHFHVCQEKVGISYKSSPGCGSISSDILNNEKICTTNTLNENQKICKY